MNSVQRVTWSVTLARGRRVFRAVDQGVDFSRVNQVALWGLEIMMLWFMISILSHRVAVGEEAYCVQTMANLANARLLMSLPMILARMPGKIGSSTIWMPTLMKRLAMR